ncbi:MAG: group III truncated hemoglobin [Cyclobacteriaceae bacterium]|nr:group III truncated hemoglobin [Cyclobacteriaceae bacterium]
MKPDITTRQDVYGIVVIFYDLLLSDPITEAIFENIDMKKHIPIITDFWCMVLFGDTKYKGNPFPKHEPLGLEKKHFERWLFHFENTINESYKGDKAELAKQRANSIAFVFQSKLGAY